MECHERERLQKDYDLAVRDLHGAVRELLIAKTDFAVAQKKVETARISSERAREAVVAHRVSHGC
jgi:hypothetical protein